MLWHNSVYISYPRVGAGGIAATGHMSDTTGDARTLVTGCSCSGSFSHGIDSATTMCVRTREDSS